MPRTVEPITSEPIVVIAPRQWKCEEQPELRLYLANLSYRPKARELQVAPEDMARHRRGDNFLEEYAHFHGGKFVTSDPAVAAELERIELAGLAPIFEDYAPDELRCTVHGFATTNPAAWAAHVRTKHKAGFAPALLNVAQDDLGQELETEY